VELSITAGKFYDGGLDIMTVDVTETGSMPTGASARIFNMTAPGPSLPWSWAQERLAAALLYWVTTASASGFPHSRPVWGVWHHDSFWFASQNRCIQHLAENPQASINLTQGEDVVVVEGTVEQVTDDAGINVLVDGYAAKYAWDTHPADGKIMRPEGTTAPVYRVTPVNVYGWPLAGWENVTRWKFPKPTTNGAG
jgi:hypothetical protein